MRLSIRLLSMGLGLGVAFGQAAAQSVDRVQWQAGHAPGGPPPGCQITPPIVVHPAPSAQPMPSATPQGAPEATPAPAEMPPEANLESARAGAGLGERFALGANSALAAGAGAAGTSAAAGTTGGGAGGGNSQTTTLTKTQTPLLMPGLFTAATVQSPVPLDRVFLDYGYFNGFRVTTRLGGTAAGFNLNLFDVGVEKTFFDCRASVYVSVPFLDATDNGSGLPIDGFGDVNVGFKVALLRNTETGSMVSAGMTAALPTARDAVFTASNIASTDKGPPLVTTASTTVNPTFFQPWIAGVFVADRLAVQEYFGVVVPTDDRVSTFLNNNLSVSFNLIRNPHSMLSSISPFASAQALIPVTHSGSQGAGPTTTTSTDGVVLPLPPPPPPQLPSSFGFPDQLFITGGVQFGLGERSLLSAGVVTPVVGPKAYSVGAVVGFNFLY
jgi:hypothetical protein